ncbi:hypothetical protein GJ744_004175 [Endocarpon pusillum]|uniref:Cytochrome P450 n=1 Tax=Endocarpon pusillum TaxID=364733 RepID=A0A8H7E6Y3_9EURO|nr:hypothetical protein GJ744_004175 [Endocarpon pusillum]
MREVIAPTVIGGKVLRKGRKLMVPYRQLHLNGDAWGPTTYDFVPERFINDKGLYCSPSYRPFGGGNTLCPGRFLARKMVFTTVALLLSIYDVSLVPTQPEANGSLRQAGTAQRFPRVDDTRPRLGALGPVRGDDCILVLKPLKQ